MAVPTSLDHCVIHVSDWERSNKFYVEVMGAELIARPAGFAYRFGDKQLNVHGPGVQPAEVARRLQVSRTSVWRWGQALDANGRRALRKAPRTGRPPQLTDAEKKRLVVALEAGALVQGYATDLWTLSRVGKLIEKISGKRYSESGVWRLLKGLNFSCQRPSGRAIKRDEQAIRHWKTKRWPTLKKTAPNKAEPSSS